MADDMSVYLKGAAEQLYRVSLELMSRTGSTEELSCKELKEAVAALRELIALRDAVRPASEEGTVRVVFEGGEEAWSR